MLRTCDDGADQTFTLTGLGELRVNGKCLEAKAAGTTDGTKAVIDHCTGDPDQFWNVNPGGTITNALNGLCLDTLRGGTDNGAKVILWTCNGAATPQWTIRS